MNNPLKYTDPSGEAVEWAVIAVAAVVYALFQVARLMHDLSKTDSGDGYVSNNDPTDLNPGSNSSTSAIEPTGIPLRNEGFRAEVPVGILQSKWLQSSTSSAIAYNTTGPNDWIANGSNVTVQGLANYFGGIKDSFNQGIQDWTNDTVDFIQNKVSDLSYWYDKGVQTISDITNGRSIFNTSPEYAYEVGSGIVNMSANDWAYAAGYNGAGFTAGTLVGSGVSAARFGSVKLPSFKMLKSKGGQYAGWSISRGSGYGAKPRFDFHKLSNSYKSRATSRMTIPKWLEGRKLPHYHRGRGNNLRYHRPWEIDPHGKRKW